MHTHLLLLAIAIVFFAGCGHSSLESGSSAERDSEFASRILYQCESGRTIKASYPSDSTAVVEYEGQTLRMTIAVSGSGTRYVGGGLEWWTKGIWSGYEGTL